MAKMRVYEIARRLAMESKVLIQELKKQGIKVDTHMSTLDEETAALVMAVISGTSSDVETATVEAVEAATPVPTPEAAVPQEQEAEAPEVVEAAIAVEVPPEPPVLEKIKLTEALTIKELSEKFNQKPQDVIKKLMEMGIIATINQIIDLEVAMVLAKKFGLEAEMTSDFLSPVLGSEEEDESALIPRAPVVTVMGHVDHGKTSLLDAIRETNVSGKEIGGITQHLGASEVEHEKGKVVFLDTPGHEAFTAMRARGAQATDIVVLVVAADDGVMPQTREAIAHAEAAGVPIIVAINKIDKPSANVEKVKKELVDHGLVPEAWGGQTIFTEVSAKKRIGIDHLLEMILLQAEILDLKANPNRPAKGVVIEAKLDKSKGPVATIIVQHGTLKRGVPFVSGLHYGKVRALINHQGKEAEAAGPATPVEVLGFTGVPQAGDSFVVVSDERKSRQISLLRQEKQKAMAQMKSAKVTLDDLFRQIKEGIVKELCLILRADVQGSVQALKESLEKLSSEEVRLRVIHGSVGAVTESDIILASASNAIVIGFNVRPTPKATELAKRERVDVRLYTVIYQVIDDIKSALKGLIEPKFEEKILGHAEVRQVFHIRGIGTIAGCYITDGTMRRNAEVRLIRDSKVVYQGKVVSLQRFKEAAVEVSAGFECGIGLEKFDDIKVGDCLETFSLEKVEP